MKKQKDKQRMLGATTDANEDDTFTFFISSTNIRYCFYSETQKILGNTFGMCVLQVGFCFIYFDYLLILER